MCCTYDSSVVHWYVYVHAALCPVRSPVYRVNPPFVITCLWCLADRARHAAARRT